MKILYFDCFAGISGDMTIGAMLDLGVSADWLTQELSKLGLGGYTLKVTPDEKKGISGTRFRVILEDSSGHETEDPGLLAAQNGHGHDHQHFHDHEDGSAHEDPHSHEHDHGHHHSHSHDTHGHSHTHEHVHGSESHPHSHSHNSYSDIRQLILNSGIDEDAKGTALRIFHRIARAEAKVHGKDLDTVHFHEVGAVDSIVDIVGTALCLKALGVDRIYCSPVHTGSGFIKCAHGFMPVPAPATLEIFTESALRPYATHLRGEFTTPTGAAILAEIATPLDGLPSATIIKTGYGAGTKDFEIPNMLRLILAEHPDEPAQPIWSLEANMDDIPGEVLGYTLEKLMAAGALDAYYTPVQMKKNRPGVLLTVLCAPDHRSALEALILRETTTLGLRRHSVDRTTMHRHTDTVETPWGPVRIKIASWQELRKVSPEYEDCRRIAEEQGLPLRDVMEKVIKLSE